MEIRSLVEEGYAPKVQQIELEKEMNNLISRKNEAISIKTNGSSLLKSLNFRLKAAKERLDYC